ncbi:MAG: hypothetical protein Tp152DCM46671_33 [Prokaryotic dsDNA virus sp.]|nr:MAG: hypothetical protein Tp152DCM46671_33 [Prokaryotic dsDNA virus sp.]|tara:strand:- start:29563 stop:29955 length:393 start_codon:yes stop_codon:yes gene_type:complete
MANVNLVSATSIYAGNAGWNLSATLTATLLTVDADKLVKINRITCANVDGTNAADLNLYIDGLGSGASGVTTTGADATVYLAKTLSVPPDSTLVILDTPIYLMEGDVLKGGAGAASDLDLFISYEVFDDA